MTRPLAALLALLLAGPAEPPAEVLDAEQAEYVADVMAFTGEPLDAVRERMKRGPKPLQEEWDAWEREAPMTPERVTEFYRRTPSYVYELGQWHLFLPAKRESNRALFEHLLARKPKNVLDFGGGVGLHAIPLARAGLDVTLADLDSVTLRFAEFRARRHGVPLKLWRTDVEAAAPDARYDVILAMDVLEHLPKPLLAETVDRLLALRHEGTVVIMSAPFGRTATHPMHVDFDAETQAQLDRLQPIDVDRIVPRPTPQPSAR